jgi:hypothetical protein
VTAGCSAGSTGDAHRASTSPSAGNASLATSIETSAGSWAVVPMGHLDDPLNTFWQLFFRPDGGSRWTDKDSVLAVATNGGIVLATGDGRSLVVGVRASSLLKFSPLMVTPDGGSPWSAGSPVNALAEEPDALAVGAGGVSLALTASGGGEVVESAAGLAGWHEVTAVSGLGQSSAGRSCGLASMTAVAVVGAQPVIGADCRNAGKVGIFTGAGAAGAAGAWRLVGPSLPAALDHGTVTVLGLQRTTSGLRAVLEVSKGDDSRLVAAWTTGVGATWSVSPVLDLGSRKVLSIGPDGSTGLFVLESLSGTSDAVEVVSGAGASWSGVPAPPVNTETLVFDRGGTVDALAVDDTVFTDWELTDGAAGWTKTQVVHVPIQFGSSS